MAGGEGSSEGLFVLVVFIFEGWRVSGPGKSIAVVFVDYRNVLSVCIYMRCGSLVLEAMFLPLFYFSFSSSLTIYPEH